MSNYYEATVSRPQREALSAALEAEVCIVGAGFAGLATAWGLVDRGIKDVVVLDAECVGFGASGRNGGFVFGGYSLECSALLAQLGPQRARAVYTLTQEAVALIRRRIVRHAIACDAVDGGALLANWFDDDALLRRQQRLMQEHFGVHWRFIDRSELPQWVNSARYSAALLEPDAFHFHPLKYALGEAAVIEAAGGRLFERTAATAIVPHQGGWRVDTRGGSVSARHVVVAGGGYLARLVPALERAMLPIATYVMATEPLGDAARALIPSDAALYDTRFAFDYYRKLPDTRLLWGGRISVRERSAEHIALFLKRDMLKVFPSLRDARVDYAWGGLMSYARHKMPQVGRLPGGAHQGVWYALGFGGHGVAPTTAAGELLADAIAFGHAIPADFERYGLPRTYRAAGLLAAQASYAWLQWKDRWRRG